MKIIYKTMNKEILHNRKTISGSNKNIPVDCLVIRFFCGHNMKPLKVLNLYAGIGGNREHL